MVNGRFLWLLAGVAMLLWIGGCAKPAEPYFHTVGEYNRARADFGREPEDITEVAICYNKRGTSPQELVRMARERCAEFGKVAVFEEQEHLACSLAAPALIRFRCEAPRTPFYPLY